MIIDWGLQAELTLRLVLAVLLGGIVGLERESHGRYAGLRTNTLVCVGACLLMLVSLHMEELFAELGVESVVRLDPGRIASYAIAGMGFIGAGTIIKGQGSIRGLTTAATLWLLTGVGLAVGSGFYLPAAVVALLTVAILYGSRHPKLKKDVYTTLIINFTGTGNRLKELRAILAGHKRIRIVFTNYSVNKTNQTIKYRLYLVTRDDVRFGELTTELLAMEKLDELTWEAGQVP